MLFLFLLSPIIAAGQCKDAISTKDMLNCLDGEWKKSDAELNRTYQETLKKLKPEDAVLLKRAQRSWISYRDAQCAADYKMWAGGSGAPVALAQCRVTLTQQRTKTIQDTYNAGNR